MLYIFGESSGGSGGGICGGYGGLLCGGTSIFNGNVSTVGGFSR